MPLQATSGAASYDGFGGGVAAVPTYIEEVFSTYLFTGNGTTQTVTNGIDLIGKGGMVWRKQRDATANHFLADTVRGTYSTLSSNTTAAASGSSYIDFLSDGFQAVNSGSSNPSGALQASWTFREQPKFFDIVTWTGDGTNRAIPHNLGSVPGCMIVKCTNAAYGWMVYHRSTGATKFLYLDTTDAAITNSTAWNDTAPTSTVFTVGNAPLGNESGKTYVAYLFAHDAGGFGALGTDNVISCGSCVSDGSGYIQPVSLGYEPQWVMLKRTNSTGNWVMMDTMRGMANTAAAASPILLANTSAAEAATGVQVNPIATGFEDTLWGGWGASNTYIYIAIRRGPMKTPTVGTSVYKPQLYTGTGATSTVTGVGFTPDVLLNLQRNANGAFFWDKLRGGNLMIRPPLTAAETTGGAGTTIQYGMDGYTLGADTYGGLNVSGATYSFNSLQRAPSFFDEVCYTGTGSATTFSHNLTVVPELMIVKSRTVANSWLVYISALGPTKTLTLNAVSKEATSATAWNNTAPTASVFTIGSAAAINTAASTNVAYLFATLAGISKVGNYTGTGATQTINCGFTAGARFVLIKRTDNPGAWYVWDSARGMVSGTDPSLLLNSTAAEVNANSVYAITTGFQIVTTVDDINTAGGEYIFFAIS